MQEEVRNFENVDIIKNAGDDETKQIESKEKLVTGILKYLESKLFGLL